MDSYLIFRPEVGGESHVGGLKNLIHSDVAPEELGITAEEKNVAFEQHLVIIGGEEAK